MKIKETILNMCVVITLLTGLCISIIYAANRHQQTKQREKFVIDSTAAANLLKDSSEYQFIVTDDSITVYDGHRTVGTVKLEGELDSLIIIDNQ